MEKLILCLCWTFLLQQTGCEQFVNVAFHKAPTQDGTLEFPPGTFWDVSHSVDGMTECAFVDGQHYSGTVDADTPWWQLDLGYIYTIKAMHVLGRPDTSVQLGGFRLWTGLDIGNLSMMYKDNGTDYNHGSIWVNITIEARVIKLDLPRDGAAGRFSPGPLTLCEVEVLICGPGFYGDKCSVSCGNCFEGTNQCLALDGTCPTGCAPGYNYTSDKTCKTVCSPGYYGHNCLENCGQCTNGNTSCLSADGTCQDGCAPGYNHTDRTCHTKCQLGHYGINCSETCGHCIDGTTCSFTDGTCPAWCGPGYNYTANRTCNTENSPLDKCRPGQYGQNCEGTCGHCIDGNTTCSFTDGSCLAGCASGFDYVIDMSCKTECQHGFYGLNCAETCGHCKHGSTTCSVIDGTCPSGCKPGYNPADSTCKTGVNILQAPGFSVNTSQSSQHLGSDARRAIDGLKGPDPETCNCCSQTQNAEVSWWQVDMGVVLPIGEIVLYGQNDTRYQQLSLSGFSVYLSTSVSFPDVPFVKAHDDVANATYHIDVQGNFARYVRIQRIGVLIICEVEIFLSDKTCPPSTYTVYCIPCGHCYAGLPCDDITGRCPNGCETGYSGDTCNQAINTGTSYGTKDVIGAGIGGTIGGAIFILLIVMLVLRRKKLRCPWVCQTSQDYESPKPRENRDDQNMYDVLDIPDLSDQSVSGINPATPNNQNTNI